MKTKIKKIVKKVVSFQPIKNIILFESFPDYSDNTKNVFDEMIAKGVNNKYKLVWICYDNGSDIVLNQKFKDVKNVKFVSYYDKVYKLYYKNVAKAYICCNMFFERVKPTQKYFFLAHGCALKNASGKYSLPKFAQDADVMTISDYLAPFDAHNLRCNVECMKNFGYARNDDLFEKINPHIAFSEKEFDKIIYWLPTYRQHSSGSASHSDISMPILYTEKEAQQLNECAKNNDTLIVVKVHKAQDLTMINEFNLSNLIFIKNDFFYDKDFTNYQVLGSVDAMISDYSSVYYDYLLCDKPIGLCFDDFEEYNKREGFTMDPNVILKGGEKLYNIDDLCAFVESVANGEDELSAERNEIKNLVHDHIDNKSAERIVDYIMTKL